MPPYRTSAQHPFHTGTVTQTQDTSQTHAPYAVSASARNLCPFRDSSSFHVRTVLPVPTTHSHGIGATLWSAPNTERGAPMRGARGCARGGLGARTEARSAAKPGSRASRMMAATIACSQTCARERASSGAPLRTLLALRGTHHCMQRHRRTAPQTLPPLAGSARSRTGSVPDESAHSETNVGGSDSGARAAEEALARGCGGVGQGVRPSLHAIRSAARAARPGGRAPWVMDGSEQ